MLQDSNDPILIRNRKKIFSFSRSIKYFVNIYILLPIIGFTEISILPRDRNVKVFAHFLIIFMIHCEE